ncbi:MAG: ECF transporter S component [Lachnospiraceae bacterium]|jgi:energy-coupling factor transport system substrate-specific component|nr:ECF transporter S component [Lachnospiraceae bacterium]
MKKTKIIFLLDIVFTPIILIILTIFNIPFLPLVITVLLLLSIVPFVITFERKDRGLSKIVGIVVMASLAIAARWFFVIIPNFKPTYAIIIITGMVFGKNAGYMTGVLTALVSNMVLGQGAWTPWQMVAWGIMGYIAGIRFKPYKERNVILSCILGFILPFLAGWFMNLQYTIMYIHPFSIFGYIGSCVTSLGFDLANAISTTIFLGILLYLWEKKLTRLRERFDL